jgi:hypothetical protein
VSQIIGLATRRVLTLAHLLPAFARNGVSNPCGFAKEVRSPRSASSLATLARRLSTFLLVSRPTRHTYQTKGYVSLTSRFALFSLALLFHVLVPLVYYFSHPAFYLLITHLESARSKCHRPLAAPHLIAFGLRHPHTISHGLPFSRLGGTGPISRAFILFIVNTFTS